MVMTPVRHLPKSSAAERRGGGWLLPLVSLVVVLAVLGGAYAYFTRQAATHRSGQAPSSAVPSQPGPAPRSVLATAADALAGYTPPPAEGHYTHVWTEQ